jgi:SulP family sulfate permease
MLKRLSLRAYRSERTPQFIDAFGGVLASILTIAFGLSYAVLIFSGPLAQSLNYGIATTFLTTAVIATIVTCGSTFSFAVAGPETSTAAVAAILSAAVSSHLATQPGAALLTSVLMTMAGAAIVTGLVLCGLGMTRLGQAIRYVPYPVIGGFLAATGYLVFIGGTRVTVGHSIMQIDSSTLHDTTRMAELAAAFAMAATMFLSFRKYHMPFAMPIILIATVVAANIFLIATGMPMETAQAEGWMFAPQPHAEITSPWTLDAIAHYPWAELPSLAGNIAAVVFVTTISALFNTTGIEVAAHREVHLTRELNVAGVANIVSGLFGGYTGCISLSRSMLNYNIGAASRLSGLIVACSAAYVVIASPTILGYIPRFALGGLLIYLGLDQCRRWVVESWQRLSLAEYLSLIAIAIIIVVWGFIAGILIGVVIGCATFAMAAARIPPIKYRFDGTEYRSSLDHGGEDRAVLLANGTEIQGLAMQGYLFFGSANRLYDYVKLLVRRVTRTRFLIFDFTLVTGADSSAAHSFLQIKRLASDRLVRLILVGIGEGAEKTMRASGFLDDSVVVMRELDHALEYCENAVIAEHTTAQNSAAVLCDWFTDILGSAALADSLIRRCSRAEIDAGTIIARAGDVSDSMYFILSGRIGIMANLGDGRCTRLRSLGRVTSVGEMGLVSNQPRSATLETEMPSVVYVLTRDAYRTILQDEPALAQALLGYFMSVTAERLMFANRTITALRR